MSKRISIRVTRTEYQLYELLLETARKKNKRPVSMNEVMREVAFGNVLEVPFTEEELSVLPYPPDSGHLRYSLAPQRKRVLHHPSARNVLIFWRPQNG